MHFAAVVTRLVLGGVVLGSWVSMGEALTDLVPLTPASGIGHLVIDGVRQPAPALLDLGTHDTHSIRVEIPGFRPYGGVLARAPGGGSLGLEFLETPGSLLIDPRSGEIFHVSFDETEAILVNKPSREVMGAHGLHISMVNGHRRTWRKIARLEPLPSEPGPRL